MQKLGIFTLALGLALPSPAPASEARDLCEHGRAEGTYVTTLGGAGRVRVSIVCFGPEKIGANIRSLDSDFLNFTLLHVAVDGDQISFLSYSPDGEDARGVAAHGLSRIRLHLPSLRQGRLRGDYRGLRSVKPLGLSAEREAPLPHLLGAGGGGGPVEGEFRVEEPGLRFSFSLETVGGIQRANLVFDDASGYFLANGLDAREAGPVFYVSSGVLDDELGRANLIHLRGRALSESELEVYYLDTRRGLLGPFRARRF